MTSLCRNYHLVNNVPDCNRCARLLGKTGRPAAATPFAPPTPLQPKQPVLHAAKIQTDTPYAASSRITSSETGTCCSFQKYTFRILASARLAAELLSGGVKETKRIAGVGGAGRFVRPVLPCTEINKLHFTAKRGEPSAAVGCFPGVRTGVGGG